MEAVVRRVLWLLDESRAGADPATKVLVFSEWEDALRVGPGACCCCSPRCRMP